jgi:tetratricopeptide (TPR) repeat protein
MSPMAARDASLPDGAYASFGTLLRVLRRRRRLTQRDLGIAVGYSEAQISRLEQGARLPDPALVAALFVPALGLSGDAELAGRLHELALAARDGGATDEAATHPDELAAIPPAPNPRVDRLATTALLRERLSAARCVLVCGPPGTGKSALGAGLATALAGTNPVCWLSLTDGITTPAEAVIRRLARFLERQGEPEAAPLVDPSQAARPLPFDEQMHLLTTALNRGEALICLDNAQLLDAEPRTRAVIEHLAAGSRARLLAMSREDIQLAGFEPFRLGGLDRDEAKALAAKLAGDALSMSLTNRLIDRTGGSPMLLRLALGPVTGQSGQADLAALVDRLEAQSAVSGYLLSATLASLSEPGRLLTDLLAVFRHPVDLMDARLIEATQAAEGGYEVLSGVEELRRRQLVDDAARAALHPLVHDYVYAALAGPSARRRGLHRIAAAHCERVLGDPLEAAWHLTRAGESERAADLLVSSVKWLAATGRSVRGAALAAELLDGGDLGAELMRQLMVARGDLLTPTEQTSVAERAYRDALARPAPPAVLADITWRLAQNLLLRGQAAESLRLCQDYARDLADDDVVLRAQLATVRSQAHLLLSEFGPAADEAGQAVELAEQFGAVSPRDSASVRCRAFGVLGVVARLRGQTGEAGRLLLRALAEARSAGLPNMAGRALFNLAAIEHERGDLAAAKRRYSEALAEMRTASDSFGTASVLHALGMIHARQGAPDDAMALLMEATALRRRLGDIQGAANSEHAYAHVLLRLGKTAQARELITAALESTASLGERHSQGHYLDSLAMLALLDGDVMTADRYLDEAFDIAQATSEARLGSQVRLHRAMARLMTGDVMAARELTAAELGQAAVGDAGQAEPEGLAVAACVALASADLDAADACAAELGRLARAGGLVPETMAATRLTAAVGAARAGAAVPSPATYPRLIWVTGVIQDARPAHKPASAAATS